MAFSFVDYTGDGVTTDYSITFSYLVATHVKVSLDGVDTTLFTFPDSSTVRFNTAPGSNVAIRIRRESSRSARLTDYTVPGALTEEDLDQDSTQAFFLAQEALDDAEEAINLVQSVQIDQGNVPTPANPGDNNKVLRALIGAFDWETLVTELSSDTTPQLGGNLDVNGNGIAWSGKTITDFLDEDAMTSDSAVAGAGTTPADVIPPLDTNRPSRSRGTPAKAGWSLIALNCPQTGGTPVRRRLTPGAA